jgi:hypothetical protein
MSLPPSDIFKLEKSIWTDSDFDAMGWHDVVIHSFTYQPYSGELLFDIDYIFAWVEPEPPSSGYTFWVAPVTLVFKNMCEFIAELEGPLPLEVMHISRKDPRPPKNAAHVEGTEWTWTLELQQGRINFAAVGYTQFTRRRPIRTESQSFSLGERGGISFDLSLAGS